MNIRDDNKNGKIGDLKSIEDLGKYILVTKELNYKVYEFENMLTEKQKLEFRNLLYLIDKKYLLHRNLLRSE